MSVGMAPRPEGGPVDPDLLAQFVENQTRELEIRAHELEVQKHQDNNNLKWAQDSLAAQERDRAHERTCNRGKSREKMIFFGVLAILLSAVILFAMAYDKDAVAMELVKAIILLMAGAAGGYGVGRSRNADQPSEFSKQ